MKKVKLTSDQERAMRIVRVGMMNYMPLYAYLFYEEIEEFPTLDVDTAGTDGKRVYYNPEYLSSLKPPEAIFALCHEMQHFVLRHPTRMKHYRKQGDVRGLPYDQTIFNVAADLLINGFLVRNKIGLCNPSWLYDPDIEPNQTVEDLYEKLYKKSPPPPGSAQSRNQGPEQERTGRAASKPRNGGSTHTPDVPKYGDFTKGGKPDKVAAASGGRFDEVTEPRIDPVTGVDDVQGEGEFREALSRAATAAKAMGKLPGELDKLIGEILEPQISWREHIRLTVTGKFGQGRESWERLNRRRLALSQGDPTRMIGLPGRKGFGADHVAVVIDSSGSIYASPRVLEVFFSELGGIMADVRPKNIHVIHCDAAVQRVDVCRSLAEVEHVKVKGTKGGGGTDFRPAFRYLSDSGIVPECLVYLTDGFGTPPAEAPRYPTVWCITKGGQKQPFGDHVWIEV